MRVENSLLVNARPEQVFPLLENPHSLKKWVTFLRQVQWATGSGIGARDRCQLKIGGMTIWGVAQVDVYEKNVRIGRKSVKGMKIRSDIRLVPEGPHTRVNWAISYRPPMGPLGSLLDAVVMGGALRKGVATSLIGLKCLAESGHPPSSHKGSSDLRDALKPGTPSVLVDGDFPVNPSLSEHVQELGARYRS